MKRNSFVFYASYYDAIKNLPEEQQGQMYKIIIEYVLLGKEPKKMNSIIKTCFLLTKPYLDIAIVKYENGKKGGAPKGNSNAKKQPRNNQETTQIQPNNNLKTSNINMNMNINNNIYNKQDKTKQVNRIEEKNNQVQSSPDKKIYFYEILTNKNKKLQEKNLEDSSIFNRLQNLFDQMSKENYFTTNLQTYKIEDVFEQMLNLFSGTDNEVIERITSIFDMVDNNTQVKNKYKYTISVLYQQSKELFVNLPKRQD